MNLAPDQLRRWMQSAIEAARRSMRTGAGGPFGACIVREGELIAACGNTVLRDHDPTAHAEINAIREAGRKLNAHWLQECILIATCQPCPMCLAAIYWARIKAVYFGCSGAEASAIGFADQFIQQELAKDCADRSVNFHPGIEVAACRALMKSWLDLPERIDY